MAVQPIPEGFHTITPYLLVPDVDKMLAFLESAFAAKVKEVARTPDGTAMHAQVLIGDSMLMMGAASGEYPPMPSMLYFYVDNVDSWYVRAINAGAESMQELRNEFYGDRTCGVKDQFGNQFFIATHIEDVDAEEIGRRMAAARGA